MKKLKINKPRETVTIAEIDEVVEEIVNNGGRVVFLRPEQKSKKKSNAVFYLDVEWSNEKA